MPAQHSGSKKWPDSDWRSLLKLVLPALDDSPYKDDWTLGGGTGLAVHYNHRISYDIGLR